MNNIKNIRLFVNSKININAEIYIDQRQVHYLKNVMRCNAGDLVKIFDGINGEWIASLSSLKKNSGYLLPKKQIKKQEVSFFSDITLIFSPVKKIGNDFIIQKATELGVKYILPVISDHSSISSFNLKRAKLISIESAEQSRRLTLPEINNLLPLEDVINSWSHHKPIVWGDTRNKNKKLFQIKKAGAFLIGPEGGFSKNEINILDSKNYCNSITLGPIVLRSETAVISFISLYNFM